MQSHGWSLLFHDCLVEQLQKLKVASDRAEATDPSGFSANANVKLYRALSQLIFETVPSDPAREEYRQGNTMGTTYRHWRRVKIGRRGSVVYNAWPEFEDCQRLAAEAGVAVKEVLAEALAAWRSGSGKPA